MHILAESYYRIKEVLAKDLAMKIPKRLKVQPDTEILVVKLIIKNPTCPHCGSHCVRFGYSFKRVYNYKTDKYEIYCLPRIQCTNDNGLCKNTRGNKVKVTHCCFPRELVPYEPYKADLVDDLVRYQQIPDDTDFKSKMHLKYGKYTWSDLIKTFIQETPVGKRLFEIYHNIKANLSAVMHHGIAARLNKYLLPANEMLSRYRQSYIKNTITEDALFSSLLSKLLCEFGPNLSTQLLMSPRRFYKKLLPSDNDGGADGRSYEEIQGC